MEDRVDSISTYLGWSHCSGRVGSWTFPGRDPGGGDLCP